MAITGKFLADFDNFYTAATKADAALGGMQTSADKAAGAVDRIGVAAQRTGAGNSTLHTSFQKFDSILASMGINIGTDVKALGELTQAAGQTTSSLGGLATAGLAAGAAFAGWKIGRLISETFDLDKAIGDLTAKALGWGDAAGQEAAAGADTLAKASKLTGIAITDMDTAIKVLSMDAKDHAAAMNTSASRVAGWGQEIQKVKDAGAWQLLTADLKSQNFELKELSDRYGISVDAIQFFTKEQKKADDAIIDSNQRKIEQMKHNAAAQKEAQAEAEKLFEATTHLAFAQGNYTDLLRQSDPVLVAAIEKYQKLGLSVGDIATIMGVSESKVSLISEALLHQNDVLDEAHAAWQKLEAAQAESCHNMLENTLALVAAEREAFRKAEEEILARQARISATFARTYDLSTQAGMDEFKKLNPMATFTGAAADFRYFLTHTLEDAIRAGLVNLYGNWNSTSGRGGTSASLAGPMVGVGGGTAAAVIVNVNGSVLSTEAQLAQVVGDAVWNRQRSIGTRIGAGG